jgi:ATP-binding cassette subfamily B protein
MCLLDPTAGKRSLVLTDGSVDANSALQGQPAKAQANTLIPLTRKYARLFAYVPQGNDLMNGTIEHAIAFGHDIDTNKIWHTLKLACAADFVSELPDGLQTTLGERGSGLSEGQIQRIAIARALYTDRPILVLDECTSSLDSATEERLIENLKQLTDKTIIIVTHRPAALKITDRQIDFEAL